MSIESPVTSVMGYQQLTSLSGATALTVPVVDKNGLVGTPRFALIRAETQAVRYRDDGTDPSATVGEPLAVGDVLNYRGPLNKLKFIEQTASAKLNVTYYS